MEQKILRVYLDNCCYNRPYDDQTQIRISLESQAKLHIQNLIKNGQLELVTSYMLFFENSQDPVHSRRSSIKKFLLRYADMNVSESRIDIIKADARKIMETGIKYKDACHVACAILSNADFFLTTDKRLLKYDTNEIIIMNPIDFLTEMEEK